MTIQQAIEKCQSPHENNLSFKFTYNSKEYELFSGFLRGGEEPILSVWDSYQGMNVGKITTQYVSLYSYDMMGQRTTYKMAIEKMVNVEETTKHI